MAAVLARALHDLYIDFHRYIDTGMASESREGSYSTRMRLRSFSDHTALRWMHIEGDSRYLFAFETICGFFSLNAKFVRRAVEGAIARRDLELLYRMAMRTHEAADLIWS